MNNYLIKNAKIVNDGIISFGFVLVRGGIIRAVGTGEPGAEQELAEVVDAGGKYLLPGVIDDQVHFREPGLTHKAEIATESKAAVAGGITSFMEMPNTKPQATTIEELEKKYQRASEVSMANFSFYLGATNDNMEEIRKLDPARNCGLKVFMGSSTGNMLVDKREALEKIFAGSPTLIATHCEDEATIVKNTELARETYGENVPVSQHPLIRSEEACYLSSSLAVELAKKHKARLHVLHISTAKELDLFQQGTDFEKKQITAEVCIHHLWFHDGDYERKGPLIKWNPAVKTIHDRDSLLAAVLNDKLDVIATDHAPHTIEEKQSKYFQSPSGGPMVQHALPAMLELVHQGKISIEKVVEKMCHAPARLFGVKDRGFIEPGLKADLVLVDMEQEWTVAHKNIHYKCGWSPFEGLTFHSKVSHTWVNGKLAYKEGLFNEMIRGERLEFVRS
ncbi:MAG: dihydroorotase [Bacteroidetes bacterium]|nr:MAG: dihydroorotase [Bacteroidota bacterium]RLD71993.1 MAG: dihydroorotase [Bacteroidota bacterium]RLD93813.1 MAG: dihydroorotase [Bacteroidota bacterium]